METYERIPRQRTIEGLGGLHLDNHVPPPEKKIREKYFSGNYYVKFGYFRANIV